MPAGRFRPVANDRPAPRINRRSAAILRVRRIQKHSQLHTNAPAEHPRLGVRQALASGTFQPFNRRQQDKLATGVRSEGTRVRREQHKTMLVSLYKRNEYERELARQRGDAAAILRFDRQRKALEPHLTAAGIGPTAFKNPLAKTFAHLAGDTITSTIGFVPGVYEGVKHPERFAKNVGKQYAHTYGPLAHGNVGEFAHRFQEHPLGPLLDVTGAASIAAKVGDVAAVGRAGGVRAAGRAIAGKQTAVPPERFVGHEGGQVQFVASPSVLTRKAQHAVDRFSERHPDLPVLGAPNRIARRVPFHYERALERAEEPAIPFSRARRPLARNKAKDVAYALLHDYGDQAGVRLEQEIAMREGRLHGQPGPHSQTPADLLEKAHQVKSLALLKAARKHVRAVPPSVVNALQHGRSLAEQGQQLKVEMGELSPDTAAEAIHRHSRMVTGGRFVDFPAPTKALTAARTERDRLGKQAEKAVARREANLQKLLAKEQAKAEQARPLTLGEAQDRLRGLEKHHEEIVKKMETSLREHPVTPERAQQLVAEHEARIAKQQFYVDAAAKKVAALSQKTHGLTFGERKALAAAQAEKKVADKELAALVRQRKPYEQALKTGKYVPPHDAAETARRNLARRKGLDVPTLAEEVRQEAFNRLDALAKEKPGHPVIKRYLALRDEMERLQGGIQGVHEIQGGLAGGEFGRQARKQELEQLLGTAPSAGVRPSKLGQRAESQGAWLRAAGHAKAERLGGALSVAEDRVRQLETRALRKHGVVPGRVGGRELVGGENAGEGAAFIPDVARLPGRRVFQIARNVTNKRQPLVHKSGGILFGEGRARRGSRVVLEDYLRASRTHVRDQMAEEAGQFARPLEPSPANPTGLLPGHTFYNPEGVTIARRLREQINEDTLLGRTPQEVKELLEARRTALEHATFPDQLDVRGLSEAQQEKLMQIDERLARAYRGGRLRLSREDHPVLGGLVGAIDASNNLARMGVLYLKGAFIPLNLLGNTTYGLIHQGPHFPINLARALPTSLRPGPLLKSSKLLGDLRPETLRRLDTEVGSGAAVSVSGDATGPFGRITRAIAHFSNAGADLLPRRAAIIYELRKRGFKTDAQVNRLLDEARDGDPAALGKANQISETSERAMVQFRGMHPDVRAVVTRAIFIAPWLRGASHYVLRMPLDRPLRAAGAMHTGQEGYRWQHEVLGALPSYLEQLLPVGSKRRAHGTEVIPVRNPISVTPLGTLADVLKAAEYGFQTHQVPPAERPVQFLQPGILGALEAVSGHNFFYGNDYPASKGPAEIFLQGTVGSFPLIHTLQTAYGKGRPQQQEGSPVNQSLYIPEHGIKAALDELALGSGRERLLNLPAAHAKARQERRTFMTPEGKVREDAGTLTRDLTKLGRKLGEGAPPTIVRQAIQVYQLRALNRLKYHSRKGAKLDARDRFIADGQTLLALHKIDQAHFDQGKTEAESLWKTGLRSDGSSLRKDGRPLTDAERGRFLNGETSKLSHEFGWDLLLAARKFAESKGYDLALPRLP